jgi:hypothetical protein
MWRLFKKSKPSTEGEPSTEGIDEKIIPEIKSMLEAAFEYSGFSDEIETIYVFNSTEEAYLFSFFFRLNDQIAERHELNLFLEKKCDTSPERQSSSDDIGLENLRAIAGKFKAENLEVPTRITIEYFPKTQTMSTNLSYEQKLVNSDLMEEDLIKEWMESLK